MPATWRAYSKEVIGYVAPQTVENEEYVATIKIQKWLDQGKTSSQIGLMWNAGEKATKCSSGINKHGIRYDSCGYVKTVQKHLALLDQN